MSGTSFRWKPPTLKPQHPELAISDAKLRANGWESVLAQYRPALAPPAPESVTVGQYIASAKAIADIAPRTLETYCRGLRKIASDILELPDDGSRYDAHGLGRSMWLAKVDAVTLSEFTASRVAAWKRAFLCWCRGRSSQSA